MTTITFDTLAYVKTLREAGIEEKQAEAQAVALADVLKSGATDLATQRDIESLRSDVKRDIELLRAELKKDIAETKAELIRWIVGVGILARLTKVI